MKYIDATTQNSLKQGSNGIIRSFGWRDDTDVYVNL